MTYRTAEGDVLDEIAHRLMGAAEHVVQLMEANRHAAGLPVVLPAGIDLAIPVPAAGARETRQPIRLWGGGA